MSTIINLHAIQSLPPTLLNRGAMNETKTITMGGVSRIRVSSQSWKRAMRNALRESAVAGGAFARRSNHWPAETAKILVEDHGMTAERAQVLTHAAFAGAGNTPNDKGLTPVSMFAHENMAHDLAAAIAKHEDEFTEKVEPAKKDGELPTVTTVSPDAVTDSYIAALAVADAVDLALMGRMLTTGKGNSYDLRVDGGLSVDHATSVDAEAIEDDFFTAVDDLSGDGEAASNNLGVVDLSAPVLYRTAAIDVDTVRRNLSGAADPDALTASAVAAAIDAFVRSVPTAKQNSTNAGTRPSLVIGTVGNTRLTAHNAFTAPITGSSVVADAVHALLATMQMQRRMEPAQTTVLLAGDPAADEAIAAEADTIDALGGVVANDLADLITRVTA